MSDDAFDITFKANPIQQAFISSRARADLWASRMGEGKSTGLAWACAYHTKKNPGASWAFIRDTSKNLEATTQKEFFKWFPPGVFGSYHATKKEWTWYEGSGMKGEIVFLGLDDPSDVSKLQSRKVDGFAFDEPAPALNSGGIPETVFDIALSRQRDPGMKWYPMKLATNNPDETHWTYRRFVDPGEKDFVYWQARAAENERNLKAGYYEDLRTHWGHNQDFVRRFVDGKFGFVADGTPVTPQWSDDLHLAIGLVPMPGKELLLLWDFGLNPTCIVSQVTPMGSWNILESWVGEGIGVVQLVDQWVQPAMQTRYKRYSVRHIGDPAGQSREASDSTQSAVRTVVKAINGRWVNGPRDIKGGLEPLRHALSLTMPGGRGFIQVDRGKARDVYLALRGGWHYHKARTGVTSVEPVKNIHSHPGDAMRYGAGILFPIGTRKQAGKPREGAGQEAKGVASYSFGQPAQPSAVRKRGQMESAVPGREKVHGEKLGG